MKNQEVKDLLQQVRAIALDDMPSAVSKARLYEEMNSQYPTQKLRISKVSIFVKSLINTINTK
jgi:hypothetical protein